MAEDMSVSQALGVLRRAGQALKFVQDLEDAARAVIAQQGQAGGLAQALAEKRKELAASEEAYQARAREMTEAMEGMERTYSAKHREHDAQCDTLDQQLEEKQVAVKQAMEKEDALYLAQCAEHQARVEALQATIQEKEGYLATLNQRIGQLKADMELVR